MKTRIRVSDRVVIAEGSYWPHSKYGTVIHKYPITSGKRVISHWFVVLQDQSDDPTHYGWPKPEPVLFTRSQIEKYNEPITDPT